METMDITTITIVTITTISKGKKGEGCSSLGQCIPLLCEKRGEKYEEKVDDNWNVNYLFNLWKGAQSSTSIGETEKKQP